MRSGMIWLLASTAVLCSAVACSGDEDESPVTAGLPNQPGAGGSAAVVPPAPAPINPVTPAPTVIDERNNVMRQEPGGMTGAVAAGAADAGAGEEEPASDAGPAAPVADAAPPVVTPPPPPPPVTPPPPPPVEAVGFSDVFPILVASCGNCHGANAPGNRPRFAQTGNEAASLTAALAIGNANANPPTNRIVQRAVLDRDMPPACGEGMLGTGACLDQAEADLLQAWVAQGMQP